MTTPFLVDFCQSCNQKIIWAITTAGKRMPVDVEPNSAGTVALSHRHDGQVGADTLPVARRFGRTDLRTSHFATCPFANRHRRGRRS